MKHNIIEIVLAALLLALAYITLAADSIARALIPAETQEDSDREP